VTRREAGVMLLLSPLLVALLVIVAIGTIWKLPRVCCQCWRKVRYLPAIGFIYYLMLVPLLVLLGELGWWETLLLLGMVVVTADWLLPDPFTYCFSSRKRRAVARAIEYLEAQHRVIYDMVNVLGCELGRTIVSVAIQGSKPPSRRFLAVAETGEKIEDLDFEYVAAKYGVEPWLC
jgi:hypothetical protein